MNSLDDALNQQEEALIQQSKGGHALHEALKAGGFSNAEVRSLAQAMVDCINERLPETEVACAAGQSACGVNSRSLKFARGLFQSADRAALREMTMTFSGELERV